MDTFRFDLGQISLLIVEDESDSREMLARMISMKYAQIRLLLAENGAEGIEVFKAQHPDLVLADMNMPILDGIQMAREIRLINPQTIIIAVTAHNDPGYLMDAIETGIRHYVLKPVNSKELFAAIDKNIEEITLKRLVAEQERQIRVSEHQLAEAQKITHLGSWEYDLGSARMRWSDEMHRILGVQPGAVPVSLEDFLQRVIEDDREMVREAIEDAASSLHSLASQYWRVARPDGCIRILLSQVEVVLDGTGHAVSLIGTAHDVTERRRTEEERARLAAIVESSSDAIIALDTAGLIRSWNKGAESIFRYYADEVMGQNLSILAPHNHQDELAHIKQSVYSGKEAMPIETVWLRKGGTRIYVSLSSSPTKDLDGKTVGMSVIARDVTERREMEEVIEYRAHHDALTDLPNRQLFMDFLALELAQARRNNKKLALLFLDLDGFKQINDTMGHNWGDRLLQEVARRLRACIRESDTVARLGGDEFIVLMPDLGQTDDVGTVLHKIMKVFESPFVLNDMPVTSSTSIGVSMFPDDGDNCDDLIKKADLAMYDAKGSGKNSYQFYNAELNTRTIQRLEMETCLRQAVARGEFELLFQPMASASGEIIGAEALLRWHHPDQGLLLPEQFLPIAEYSGAIVAIGEWVLRGACSQMKEWHEKGHLFNISVNLSNRQFHQPNLLDKIATILSETGLPPGLLNFEIAEDAIMENWDFSLRSIRQLSEMGISVAIDRFGSGSSSLQGIKRIPIRSIKIDKTFVRKMLVEPDDLAVVNAVIAMSRNLNMKVIANGVENAAELSTIRESGCDGIQGFIISRPLQAAEFERFVGHS